jgi:hypothetical protein
LFLLRSHDVTEADVIEALAADSISSADGAADRDRRRAPRRREYHAMNITGSLPLHDQSARGVRPGEPGYFFSSIVVPWF